MEHVVEEVCPGAYNPKGRSIKLVIPPVVEWHLQENSIYGMPISYAWLVYYWTSAIAPTSTYHIRSFGQVLFDNRWNQPINTSLTLLPFGLCVCSLTTTRGIMGYKGRATVFKTSIKSTP